ncbi:Uncharacterised protein (plasmid) [Legionella adelaidensis]|uniref:Uncharacterized protein n=1 Tax=Legionella adelaidensis TaxID=45056 RepID=A0A0W0R2A2_9GAMM|nr:hypothetical protein [Legionella adelaidensis]KTC65118.1 hypothetical protein Lade_1641 [Legionella adelaidensis]VEH85362.1 Uncharacterised protein [Legionella adelaidensis]
MSEEVKEPEMSGWFSTYGFLTAQRILEGFKIRLQNDELLAAINNPRSIYYQLLRVPLKNVFNGIVLQQVHDYQVYAQKLFIDFLLSGQNDKDENSPGSATRDELKEHSNFIIHLGEEFGKEELEQQKLIAESQNSFIKHAAEIQAVIQSATQKIQQILNQENTSKPVNEITAAISRSFVMYRGEEGDMFAKNSSFWDIFGQQLSITLSESSKEKLSGVLLDFSAHRKSVEELLETYLDKANAKTANLRDLRHQFYDAILKAKEIIQNLPEYRPDQEKDAANLEALNFDSNIGEEN